MSVMNRVYVDFHVIQTVPPSCVNRDDTGSPKTAIYGGAVRARVSSQSWKHSMRLMFADLLNDEELGSRTKKVKSLIAEEIHSMNETADADAMAEKVMTAAGLKVDKKKGTTGALFFISAAQIKALAEIAIQDEGDKKVFEKNAKKALKELPSADMALFGRMVADDPSLNYDAASQVAHAISTHAVHNEYDYFTAVDDCAPEDNAGAAHLGTVEYNSSTLYRYATVNLRELKSSMGGDYEAALRAFAEAFIYSMPTGKQNTFANRTLPDLVYVTIRRDQPINLVGAFEKPVSGKNGYVMPSIEALANQADSIYKDYECSPEKIYCCGKGAELFGEKSSMPEIIENLVHDAAKMMEE